MSVQVKLLLRLRDDENENPTLTSTTACAIEAANGPEAVREALWDVLCRSGYSTGQSLEMLAWVIDQLCIARQQEDNPDLEQAEKALEAAADLVVKANDKLRGGEGTESDEEAI